MEFSDVLFNETPIKPLFNKAPAVPPVQEKIIPESWLTPPEPGKQLIPKANTPPMQMANLDISPDMYRFILSQQ